MSEKESCSVQELQKKISDTYAFTSNLSLFCNNLERSLQSLFGQMSEKMSESSFKAHQVKVNDAIEGMKKEFSSFMSLHDWFVERIEHLREDGRKFATFIVTQGQENIVVNHNVEAINHRLSVAINDLDDNMHANVKKAKDVLSKKIESLFIPMDTVNMDQVQKEIDSRIEPACLDARNSLLTSRNHELRLGIVEKKIENALLQLKNRILGD